MYGIKLNDSLILHIGEALDSVDSKMHTLVKEHLDGYYLIEQLEGEAEDDISIALCHDEEGDAVPNVDLQLYFTDDILSHIDLCDYELYTKLIIQDIEVDAAEAIERFKDNYKAEIYCEGLGKTVDRNSTKDLCSWSKKRHCDDHCPEGKNQKDYLAFPEDNILVSIFEGAGFEAMDPRDYKFLLMYIDYGD